MNRIGYRQKDALSINFWFLNIIPKMINEFKNNSNYYPPYFLNDYYHKYIETLGICSIDDFYDSFKYNDLLEKAEEYSKRRWRDILNKMEQAFIDSSEDTCTYKNPYKEEYDKAFKEHYKRYGVNVFKNTDEEFDKITNLYFDEEEKIKNFREKNKKEALRLFVKYFDDLCNY